MGTRVNAERIIDAGDLEQRRQPLDLDAVKSELLGDVASYFLQSCDVRLRWQLVAVDNSTFGIGGAKREIRTLADRVADESLIVRLQVLIE